MIKEIQGNGKMTNEEKYTKQLDSIFRAGVRGGAKVPGMEFSLLIKSSIFKVLDAINVQWSRLTVVIVNLV